MISRPNCSCIDNNERHTLPNQHINNPIIYQHRSSLHRSCADIGQFLAVRFCVVSSCGFQTFPQQLDCKTRVRKSRVGGGNGFGPHAKLRNPATNIQTPKSKEQGFGKVCARFGQGFGQGLRPAQDDTPTHAICPSASPLDYDDPAATFQSASADADCSVWFGHL